MATLAAFLITAGCIFMGLAGYRYWRSDLLLFLMCPVWEETQRSLFQEPGWVLYLAGTAISIAGAGLLVADRILLLR